MPKDKMKKKKDKVNQFCGFKGCQTKTSHTNDADVRSLLEVYLNPGELAIWAIKGITQLRDSIIRDIREKQMFALIPRLRQPEELYIRTVHLLLFADKDVAPHLL